MWNIMVHCIIFHWIYLQNQEYATGKDMKTSPNDIALMKTEY